MLDTETCGIAGGHTHLAGGLHHSGPAKADMATAKAPARHYEIIHVL